jgi:PAS domain S-box-containing protein
MISKNGRSGDISELRRRAEEVTLRKKIQAPERSSSLLVKNTQRMLHELQVHQVELEMQNEELQRAQAELSAARKRYFELYELAPAGYLTVNEDGLILESNLTAANLLCATQSDLIRKSISRFIIKDDQDSYHLHAKQLFATGEPKWSEIRMVKSSGELFWGRLDANIAQGDDGAAVSRIILSDITARKRDEEAVKERELYRRLSQHLEAVREEERIRLSRELHDDIGQILTAIKIDLGTIEGDYSGNGTGKDKMGCMQQLLSEGIQRIHSLCRQLRPGALDDLGLNDALAGMTDDWRRSCEVVCNLYSDVNDEELSDEIKTAIFRIVQEALTNISRYASASEVKVSLAADEQNIIFSVADNGCGMKPGDEKKTTAFGLLGMHERIQVLGGKLRIESRPGKGTCIEGAIPLEKKSDLRGFEIHGR